MRHFSIAMLALSLLVLFPLTPAEADEPGRPRVEVVRTPAGGIQPQAVIDGERDDSSGLLQGRPRRRRPLLRSQQGGADPLLAAHPGQQPERQRDCDRHDPRRPARPGQGGPGPRRLERVAEGPPPPSDQGAPMLYARSDLSRSTFEPRRNLMQRTFGLDGGGTVAADSAGTVYVGWHGRTVDAPDGEAGRADVVFQLRRRGSNLRARRARPEPRRPAPAPVAGLAPWPTAAVSCTRSTARPPATWSAT